MTLSKEAEELVDELEEAAKAWGWQSDQGYRPEDIASALVDYEQAGEKLRQYIANLEHKVTP